MDTSLLQQLNGRLKAPAARADQRDFVDDDASCVDSHFSVNGRLHDDCAPWTNHVNRSAQSLRRTGCIDDVWKLGVRELGVGSNLNGFHARRCADGKFRGVAAVVNHMRAVCGEYLSDQEAELSITENGDPVTSGNLYLIKDLAGSGERLNEDRLFGRDGIGDDM